MHLVTSLGIGPTYPSYFSDCKQSRSQLLLQMDIARGGCFPVVPLWYPRNAVFHYNDWTCTYACQGTEFFYWALTSLLSGQDARAEENKVEWEANTASKLKEKLPGMFDLLTNGVTGMKLLSETGVLPGSGSALGATGTYSPASQTCSNGCGLDGSAAACGPLGEGGSQCTTYQQPKFQSLRTASTNSIPSQHVAPQQNSGGNVMRF